MRKPNKYGSVVQLNGKRRRPFAIKVTVGLTDEGKQIRKYIAYFATRREAEEFLVKYNKSKSTYTYKMKFSEIYEIWSERKFKEVGESSQSLYELAYRKCEKLHNMDMLDIKTLHMQEVLDDMGNKYDMKKKVSYLMSQIFDYCMKNDIVLKDYSKYLELGKKVIINKKVPFSKKEIKRLWDNIETPWVDTILILIYTGLRIGELLLVKNEDVNLEEGYFRAGIKTEAGINRLIPIHSKILPLIQNRMNDKEYLILNDKGKPTKYSNYRREKFDKLMKMLNMDHTPHDTRHTFATLLNNADANSTSITKLIGHKNFTTTEKIYTHKNIEELKKAIEKI